MVEATATAAPTEVKVSKKGKKSLIDKESG